MTPSELPAITASNHAAQLRRVGILICLALSAGICLTWFLDRSSIRSYPGALRARTTVVTTSRAAVVHDVSAKTGQSVDPGEALFQLIDARLEDQLVSKRREIGELEADVIRARAAADVELVWRRRELQTEIFDTQLKMAGLCQEKLNKQVEQIAWKERLSSSDLSLGPLLAEQDHPFRAISHDLASPDDRRLQAMLREDAAAASAEALATQIALCEQRLKKLESLDKDIEAKIRASSGIEISEARLNGAKKELASLETQFKDLTVASPTYGTIGEVRLQSGDRVSNGGTLVEILDALQPHVVVQIPTSALGALQQGSKVTLVFPSNQKRMGIVASIPAQTSAMTGGTESVLAVKVEPAGKLWPKLAIGSNVDVILR